MGSANPSPIPQPATQQACKRLFFGSSFVFLPACGGTADSDILAQLLNGGRTNAADALQIVHGFERSLLLAIVDDCLGFGRTNTPKRFKLDLCCGIDIDSCECCPGKYKQRNNNK